MKKLRYEVTRGSAIGTVLTPHLHSDGHFVVSKTRFESDYIRVKHEADLFEWITKGFSVRMSNPASAAPSLISPKSIEVVTNNTSYKSD